MESKMTRIDSYHPIRASFVLVLVAVVCWSPVAQAGRSGWQRREVDWRISGGSRIKAISYPEARAPSLFGKPDHHQPTESRQRLLRLEADSGFAPFTQESTGLIMTNVIDSPPIDGFVPWIAVAVTDERSDELDLNAVPKPSVVGKFLAPEPETSYGIGLFDTGSGAHIISAADAARTGLLDHTPSMLTSSSIDVTGVVGSATVWVSQPLGLFIDGIDAIEPNGLSVDHAATVGQANVSVGVGDFIDSPNVPTVIGSPMSVFFTAVFRNDNQITIVRDGEEFTGPEISFYSEDEPEIPDYANHIPLELRPSGSVAVQYFPNILDPFDPEFGAPMSPSVMTSFLPSQSLFFVSSLDITHGGKSAIDKDGFMLDTGAQVSVISEAIAARLKLNSADADFEAEIVGVTGESIMAPGFVIDSLEIAAAPEWLSFTNVPVVMLDVDSPEGGTLEGVVGTNLFTTFNLVLRGGGLPDFGGHRLDFEPIPPRPVGDIAPGIGDGMVDLRDIAALANAWLAGPESPRWNPNADIAPRGDPDGSVDLLDLAVFAEYWLHTTAP